jgi:hypothetical protein
VASGGALSGSGATGGFDRVGRRASRVGAAGWAGVTPGGRVGRRRGAEAPPGRRRALVGASQRRRPPRHRRRARPACTQMRSRAAAPQAPPGGSLRPATPSARCGAGGVGSVWLADLVAVHGDGDPARGESVGKPERRELVRRIGDLEHPSPCHPERERRIWAGGGSIEPADSARPHQYRVPLPPRSFALAQDDRGGRELQETRFSSAARSASLRNAAATPSA